MATQKAWENRGYYMATQKAWENRGYYMATLKIALPCTTGRQRGRVVRAPDLKSVGRRFESRSDRQLMLFSEAPSSTYQLRL